MTSAAFQNLIARGLLADRPEAGVPGRLYATTDEGAEHIYRDSGTAWELYEPSGSIAEHTEAEDPHGDRAYADAEIATALATAEGYTDSELATHAADTTSVHGITDTAALVVTTDSRLSDTRTPTDGTVTTAKLVDASVTTAKIADSAITSAKIADGTITNADISTSAAIAPSKISGTAVITTDSRLSDTRTPTDNTVTTAKLVDASVTTAKLADSSVTSAKIADGTIVDADVSASAAIAASKISGTAVITTDSRLSDSRTPTGSAGGSLSGTYPNPGIASGAVDTTQIASNAVTSGKLATGAVTSTKIASGAISDTHVASDAAIAQSKIASLTTDLAARELTANKGAAGGYASLDGSGKVPSTQLPAIAITSTSVVSSQSAMLALTAQTGDVAVRTDLNKSFILAGTDPTTLGDWQELLTPSDAVSSVDGRTGVVSLTDLYDAAGAAASAQSAAEGYADSAVSTHNSSTSAHGITDTGNLVYTDDSRLSDSRTPTAHAITHGIGGGDELSPSDIGAATAGHDHDADYDAIGAASAAQSAAEGYADGLISTHEGASDPHPQYLTEAEGDAAYDAIGAASSAQSAAESYADGLISTHEGASDPHPQYLTSTEGDAAYDALGAASGAVSAHEEASDPHPQYLTESEGDAAYAALGHDHDADYAAINHDHDSAYDALGAAASAVSEHNSETTVHGITDTADLVYTSDSRLSDARTPTAHATTHATGGSDELSPTDIGAAVAGHTHEGLMPGGHASTHAIGGTDELTPADIGAATATHDHDADYAALGHDHDADYDAIGAAAAAQSAAEGYTDSAIGAITPALIGAASATHDHDADYDALGAAASAQSAAESYADGLVGALTAGDVGAVPTSAVGTASGVASLDGAGKVPSTQLPGIALTSVTVVASQSAMLALTAQTGDVAVRSDLNKTFILAGDDPTDLADWQELLTPTDAVQSVDGRSGTVSLSDLYDAAGAASSAVSGHVSASDPHGDRSYADGLVDDLTPSDIGAAPATHTHAESDVTGLSDALIDIADDIAGKLTDPTTTKGDLISRTSSGITRLPVGTSGQVLTADTGETTGLKWSTPSAVPSALDDLTDVAISSPTNGQALVYQSSSSSWVPGTVSAGASALDDLTDVAITSVSNGQVLTYDSSTSTWKNAAATGGVSSGDLATALADTTSVHGITDTALLIALEGSGSLAVPLDYTPAAHAASHGSAGSDPVTLAPSQITGTAVVTTDSRLSDSRTPSGSAGGDLSGTYPNPTVAKIQGTGISTTAPTNGQALVYDGSLWTPGAAGFSDPMTTKGDLIVRGSSSTTRLAVGTNGQVLTADSTATNGVKWASGGVTIPSVIQYKQNGTGAITNIVLDLTPTNGNTLLLLADGYNTNYISAVTQTGVTWTQLVTYASGGGARYSLWVGVVGSGASATISWTNPNSYLTVTAMEIAKTVTGTLGASATGANNSVLRISPTAGRLLVLAGGNDNTTLSSSANFGNHIGISTIANYTSMAVAIASFGTAFGSITPNAGGSILAEIY